MQAELKSIATTSRPGVYLFQVTPLGKPRMTQRDRWKQRPAVMAYRRFADRLRAEAGRLGFTPPEAGMEVTFLLPMPASWSGRKKHAMDGAPHRQKPDIDNLLKSLLDALLPDDAAVWRFGSVEKRWSAWGGIVVEIGNNTNGQES